jgi:dolichol-phosphate mannosyltransferase
MQADISIITPVFNESENIDSLCSALDDYAFNKPYTLELIFVDDGSKDDSFERIEHYPFKNCKTKLVALSKNFGSHAAVRAGLQQATGKYTMFFSADLQEPVSLIDKLYCKIIEGYDVVYVYKEETQVKKSERFFSHMYATLIRRFAVPEFPEGGLNNYMICEKVRNVLVANVEANSSIMLQVVSLGFKSTSISCKYLQRMRGTSKWTLSRKIKMFIDSFVAFSYFPVRAVSLLGIFLALIGFIYGLYIIIVRLFNLFPFSAGFPTLVSLLLIGFGLTNLSLGVIAEYLWRTLDAARGRPVFLIDKIINIEPNIKDK